MMLVRVTKGKRPAPVTTEEDVLKSVKPDPVPEHDNLLPVITAFIFICAFLVLALALVVQRLHYLSSSEERMEKSIEHLQMELELARIKIEYLSGKSLDVLNKFERITREFTGEGRKMKLEMEKMIEGAINKYDADKTALVDYALESAGGKIVESEHTYPLKRSWSMPFLGSTDTSPYNHPEVMLRPGTQPGECFAFAGSSGHVRIRLSASVYITAVTLEHVSDKIVSDITSAPKEFGVYGLTGEHAEAYFLGQYTYVVGKMNVLQTFSVKVMNVPFRLVDLYVYSNHGHPKFTCIYRFRVHGHS